MRYLLYRTFKTLLTIHKVSKKFVLPILQNPLVRTSAILSATALAKTSAEERNDTDLKFLNDVRIACVKNDDALKELMEVLSACLTEISKEYQENLEQQILIITKCTKLGPVGEHWDELIKYRIQATELREELTKYELLVQKVGQMAYNQAVTSLLSGIEDAMNLLEVHYSNLEKIVTKLAKENYYWETKLLYANRDSIMDGLK